MGDQSTNSAATIATLQQQLTAMNLDRAREREQALARERELAEQALARERELAEQVARERARADAAVAALTAAAASSSSSSTPPAAAAAVPSLKPLPSPTAGGAKALLGDEGYWGLLPAPVSFVPPGGVAQAFAPALAAAAVAARGPARAAESLMDEATYYRLAVSALPPHVRAYEAQMSARKAFGDCALRLPRWTFSGTCKPELCAAAQAGETRPVFQGEVKSVDSQVLGQALYYVLIAMTGTFFPARAAAAAGAAAEEGRRVFYAAPPVGFALLAFAHVGYFISVEMVGKTLVAPASQPFFLGSAQHAAAAAALPQEPRGAPVWEMDGALRWTSAAPPPAAASGGGGGGGGGGCLQEPPLPPAITWCTSAGIFRKLVRADARSAQEWSELYAAYEKLVQLHAAAAAAAAVAPVPASLVRGVRLLLGAHEALVEMRAVEGREATDFEATGGGGAAPATAAAAAVLEAVAEAMAWLAARCLLYTDLRGPNVVVRVSSGSSGGGGGGGGSGLPAAWLVDYDDCVVVEEPLGSAEEVRRALARVEDAREARRGPSVAQPTFAQRFGRGGEFPHLAAALDRAFARAQQQQPA